MEHLHSLLSTNSLNYEAAAVTVLMHAQNLFSNIFPGNIPFSFPEVRVGWQVCVSGYS